MRKGLCQNITRTGDCHCADRAGEKSPWELKQSELVVEPCMHPWLFWEHVCVCVQVCEGETERGRGISPSSRWTYGVASVFVAYHQIRLRSG